MNFNAAAPHLLAGNSAGLASIVDFKFAPQNYNAGNLLLKRESLINFGGTYNMKIDPIFLQIMNRDDELSKEAARPLSSKQEESAEESNEEAISTSKEESKRRIHDQAERVRSIFSATGAVEETKGGSAPRQEPQQAFPPHFSFGESGRRELTSFASAAATEPSTYSAGTGIGRFDIGNTKARSSSMLTKSHDVGTKKRKVAAPASPPYSQSHSIDSLFDESIFDDDFQVESPSREASTEPPQAMRRHGSLPPDFPLDRSSFEGDAAGEGKRRRTYHFEREKSPQKGGIRSPPPVQRKLERQSPTLPPEHQATIAPPRPRLNYPPYQEITFNNNDVICDTHGAIQESLVGNRRFFVLLDIHLKTYTSATSTVERFGIARKIVNAVREAVPPGRFIQMEKDTGLCSVARDDAATKITQHALAERVGHRPLRGSSAA